VRIHIQNKIYIYEIYCAYTYTKHMDMRLAWFLECVVLCVYTYAHMDMRLACMRDYDLHLHK
jgi:hypothetical protein